MDKFVSYIKEYINLSKEAETEIKKLINVKKFDKGNLLSEEGKICKNIYFIIKGTVRTYFYQDDKDITHWIYTEKNLVTSWYSYLSQTPSKDYIETTETTQAVCLTYERWQKLYETYPELERFGRLMIEEQLALLDDFYKGYYFLSAKEKYELLTAAFPDITLRANLGHIASMLGISQETLSRIRGNK